MSVMQLSPYSLAAYLLLKKGGFYADIVNMKVPLENLAALYWRGGSASISLNAAEAHASGLQVYWNRMAYFYLNSVSTTEMLDAVVDIIKMDNKAKKWIEAVE